jgi:asparagine synthase (glutamine-hydrolysing)
MRLERYWDIDPETRTVHRRDDDYAAHFLEVFRRAVADRLRTQADTIGIFMSGGLDSCSVVAVAQRTLAAQGGSRRLAAFSYAFDRLSRCDEREYSRAMADELGVHVEYIPAEQFWFLSDPVAFRPSLETPFLSSEALDRQVMGRAREQGARVVLTGHGGDSLLRGTPLVYADRLLRGQIGVLWEMARHARELNLPYYKLLRDHLIKPMLPEAVVQVLRRLTGRRAIPSKQDQIPPWVTPDFIERTQLAERLSRGHGVPNRFRSRAGQFTYQRAAALGNVRRAVYWGDRVAPGFGLEVRHPYLDRRLVEFLLSIPPEQIYRAGTTKWLLRRAMDGILPNIIRLRRDKTFFTDFKDFSLRDKEVKRITELFEMPVLEKLGIADAERLRSLYAGYCEGKANHPRGEMWYPTITLELWLRQHHILFEDKPLSEYGTTIPLPAQVPARSAVDDGK